MNQAELDAIKKRVENLSKANVLRDLDALAKNNRVIFEDVPKLLAEIERYEKVLKEIATPGSGKGYWEAKAALEEKRDTNGANIQRKASR